jgi:CheY-like chemotaxis protein
MATILLLEDNVELRTLLQQALELVDYVILAGSSGLEGLKLLEMSENVPDAIICDVNMPDMDGMTFIQHVRSHPLWSKTYIIVLSGREDSGEMTGDCGANAYMQKPFSVIALTRLLDQHVGNVS